MLATRTNENNSIRVTLVKWKWNSYPKVVPLNMWSILQQRNERESVLSIKLEPKSNGNLSKNVWEGVWVSVWGSESGESEHESSSPLSQPLFKEKMARAPEERQATTAMEPLEKVGPRSRWSWVGWPQGGPPGAPFRPGASSTVKFFENIVHGQKFARKDAHIIFPKGLKTQKIFLVFL